MSRLGKSAALGLGGRWGGGDRRTELNNMDFLFLKKDFIYLFLERGEGREKEKERNIDQLPLAGPQPRTLSTTQARALTGN